MGFCWQKGPLTLFSVAGKWSAGSRKGRDGVTYLGFMVAFGPKMVVFDQKWSPFRDETLALTLTLFIDTSNTLYGMLITVLVTFYLLKPLRSVMDITRRIRN